MLYAAGSIGGNPIFRLLQVTQGESLYFICCNPHAVYIGALGSGVIAHVINDIKFYTETAR